MLKTVFQPLYLLRHSTRTYPLVRLLTRSFVTSVVPVEYRWLFSLTLHSTLVTFIGPFMVCMRVYTKWESLCYVCAAAVVVVWQPFIAMKHQNLLQQNSLQNGLFSLSLFLLGEWT